MAMLFKAREEHESDESSRDGRQLPFTLADRIIHQGEQNYTLSQIKSVIGVSGPYDLVSLAPHFHRKGLHMPMLAAIMGGVSHLPELSPTHLVETPLYQNPQLVKRFPAVFLLHGTNDQCVPKECAADFGQALSRAGYNVQIKLYEGKSHTDPIIEDLLYAEEMVNDDMILDIAVLVNNTSGPVKQAVVHGPTSPVKQKRLSFGAPELSVDFSLSSDTSSVDSFADYPPHDIHSEFGHWLKQMHAKTSHHAKRRRSIVPKFIITLSRLVNPF